MSTSDQIGDRDAAGALTELSQLLVAAWAPTLGEELSGHLAGDVWRRLDALMDEAVRRSPLVLAEADRRSKARRSLGRALKTALQEACFDAPVLSVPTGARREVAAFLVARSGGWGLPESLVDELQLLALAELAVETIDACRTRTGSPASVSVHVDASAFDEVLAQIGVEVARLSALPLRPELAERIVQTVEVVCGRPDIATHRDLGVAATGHPRVGLQASQRLLDLLAALRACDGNDDLVLQGHGENGSVPPATEEGR